MAPCWGHFLLCERAHAPAKLTRAHASRNICPFTPTHRSASVPTNRFTTRRKATPTIAERLWLPERLQSHGNPRGNRYRRLAGHFCHAQTAGRPRCALLAFTDTWGLAVFTSLKPRHDSAETNNKILFVGDISGSPTKTSEAILRRALTDLSRSDFYAGKPSSMNMGQTMWFDRQSAQAIFPDAAFPGQNRAPPTPVFKHFRIAKDHVSYMRGKHLNPIRAVAQIRMNHVPSV
jgi:hypothetical protein